MTRDEAVEFGRAAFARGLDCAPALDAEFMAQLAATAADSIDVISALRAWHRGWAAANLAAPVPLTVHPAVVEQWRRNIRTLISSRDTAEQMTGETARYQRGALDVYKEVFLQLRVEAPEGI